MAGQFLFAVRDFTKAPVLFSLAIVAMTGCGPSNPRAVPKARPNPQTVANTPDTVPLAAGIAGPSFKDISAESGVDFTYHNSEESEEYTILESLGGGVAMLDFDGDGRLDLCLPGGGRISKTIDTSPLPTGLFRNLGGGRFEPVAEVAGINLASHYSHGASVGDFDSDGFPDVLITGYGGVQLWRNQGDGTFQEVHEAAGLLDSLWSTSAGWGDLNGDGHLDSYVAHYVNWSKKNHPYCKGPTPQQREICSPREFQPLPDVLYLSNGDGTFRDATEECGILAGDRQKVAGKGLGVLLCDVESDGDLDIYVANDTTENFLYLNDGHGTFREVGQLNGVAVDDTGIPNGSMGVDALDFNLDGRLDLWVANYERESFAMYRNEDAGQFLHVSQGLGITALGGLFVGFGTASGDFDHDGDEDIAISNGHVIKFSTASPRRQVPLILVNTGERFRRAEYAAGHYLSTPQEGRGLAAGDLDNDGDLDLAISRLNEPVALLANETGAANPWLSVRLIGVVSNRDAVGARLILHTSAGDCLRQIKGGGSYLSQNDRRVHWGLSPDTTVSGLTVHWPSGQTQEIDNPPLSRQLDLIEPTATE